MFLLENAPDMRDVVKTLKPGQTRDVALEFNSEKCNSIVVNHFYRIAHYSDWLESIESDTPFEIWRNRIDVLFDSQLGRPFHRIALRSIEFVELDLVWTKAKPTRVRILHRFLDPRSSLELLQQHLRGWKLCADGSRQVAIVDGPYQYSDGLVKLVVGHGQRQ